MEILYCLGIGYWVGFLVALLIFKSNKIKVDYSIEAKTNHRPNMAGEFAIYTKKHFWSKWEQQQTYADLEWAKNDAEKLKMLPEYY